MKKAEKIKELALSVGFSDCGISPAGKLLEETSRLRDWLDAGMHAEMQYMERNFEKRTDPRLLVPGAKSVISVLLNYYPAEQQESYLSSAYPVSRFPVLSKYAYGKDYHLVMKDMLYKLLDRLREEFGEIKGRAFVDSAPVLDRAWAVRAGLGWIGKNSMFISKNHGSFVFIGELISDLDIGNSGDPGNSISSPKDSPGVPVAAKNYCGNCTRCIDACPTGAIIAPGVVNSNKCISYLTIEKKGDIPEEFYGRLENRIFGCDICQDVCPWNNKPIATSIEEFTPPRGLLKMSMEDWRNLSEEEFKKLFKNSALQRAGYKKLISNLSAAGE